MLKTIFNLLYGAGEGTAWPDLDEQMRTKIKFIGSLCFAFILVLALLTLYYHLEPLSAHLDTETIEGILGSLFSEEGSPPRWLVTLILGVFVILTGLPAMVLFDLNKLHYRIDGVTFKLIETVNDDIRQAIRDESPCLESGRCSIGEFEDERKGRKRLKREFFYHYANQDQIDGYNQEEKRREVFRVWENYYVVNNIGFGALLSVGWIVGFLLATDITSGYWQLILLAAPVLTVLWWRGLVGEYRDRARMLAREQVREFFRNADGAVQRLRTVVGTCPDSSCRI